MKYLYRLIDRYEGFEVIKESNSLQEITNYAKYYDEDVTDGECWLALQRINANGAYRYITEWRY